MLNYLKTEIPEELQKLNRCRKTSITTLHNNHSVKIRFIIRFVLYDVTINLPNHSCGCVHKASRRKRVDKSTVSGEKLEILHVEAHESQLARMGIFAVRLYRLYHKRLFGADLRVFLRTGVRGETLKTW